MPPARSIGPAPLVAKSRHGAGFYREIACAFGTETTLEKYLAAARASGSRWNIDALWQIYQSLNSTVCRVQVVKQCEFLHFGAMAEIMTSGGQFVRSESGFGSTAVQPLVMNSRIDDSKLLASGPCWIEGTSVAAELTLAGENLVVGVDVEQPLPTSPGGLSRSAARQGP